jgi:hypothetical protein
MLDPLAASSIITVRPFASRAMASPRSTYDAPAAQAPLSEA